jgi:RNA polymerase sigma-70 factor, ECF subfamily
VETTSNSTNPDNQSRGFSAQDERDFEELFARCTPKVYKFAYGLLKSGPAAEEIVQDCFLKIWERRHQLHTETSLQGYLFTVAHNLVTNQLRQERRRMASLDQMPRLAEADSIEANSAVELAELEQYYQQALDLLPPKRRLIFLMSRQQGLSYNEIAAELQLSVKTVEAQISHALKFLHQYLRLHGAKLAWLPLVWAILHQQR